MSDPDTVEVSVHVEATPAAVYPYLTDPDRYVQWMGSHATLEPVAGGTYRVHMSDGFKASGTFLDVEPPHRLTFTWGFADDAAATHVKHDHAEASGGGGMPAGSTRVVVTLEEEGDGTLVSLRHEELPNSELRDAHRVAWGTYLPRLAIRAAGGDPGPDPHA